MSAGSIAPDRGLGRPIGLALAGFALLVLSGIVALGFGAVPLPLRTVWSVIAHEAGFGAPGPFTRAEHAIVWGLRLPRVILGAAAGAALACVGGVLQVLTRNPLADPYLFGVSAGAAFGAVLVILYAGALSGPLTLPGAAFLGALAAMAVVFAAARGPGRAATSERLVLTGVAVAFILHAGTSFLVVGAADRGAEAALFWMMGSLATARWSTVAAPVLLTLVGGLWLGLRAASLNALAFGDDAARSLGVDAGRLRLEAFLVTSLMTGAVVAASGGIGFVGLVLPHIVRLALGGDLRRLLPAAALLGAVFLVWVDVLARTALAPREVPLGVVTASLGGLFFLWLLRRRPEL